MATIRFNQVRLTGFGPYRETCEFTFSDQLNVLVAPNETGKSTLVAGVSALLFGLPQTTDPKVFGQARYRNWDHPLRFEGELIYTVDAERYRLRRDFQNNQISFAKQQAGEYRELISGTHNPRAQRRNQRYEETLKGLLGISSQELFEATFCLTQPLPEAEEIDSRVQELLSGTGVGFKQVTERLSGELREITRFTGRRGVTAKDAIEPRALERLEAEIQAIETALERDKGLVDQLETYRRHLAEEEQRRMELAQTLATREQMLTLWAQWQQLKKSYQAAQVVYTQVDKSKAQAQELDDERRRVDERKATCAWGPQAPVRTAEILSELEAIAEQKAGLSREIAELEANGVTDIQEEEAQNGQEDHFTLDWSVFGSEPTAVVQRRRNQAQEALTAWADWEQLKAATAENSLLQEEEFQLFKDAAPATLDTLKVYEPRQALLRSALENATLKWEQAEEELRKLRGRAKLPWVLSILMMLIGGGLGAFLAGGSRLWLFGLGGLAFGAGCGYLAGRLLFPTTGLAQAKERVAENGSQVKVAAQALSTFEAVLQPFTEQYTDLPTAYRRWEQIRTEGEDLARGQREFSRRELGGYAGPAEECPLEPSHRLNDHWSDLINFIQVIAPQERLGCLGELVVWLQEKSSRWWEGLIDEAAAFEEKSAHFNKMKVRQEANQEYLAKQKRKQSELTQNEEKLQAMIEPLLKAADGDYQQAGKLWATWQELKQKAEETTAALRHILLIQGVNTLEELEAKRDDASIKAQALYGERQKLISAHPGLAPLEEETDPEWIEADYRRRQEEITGGQAELRGVEAEIHRLTTEIARLEGQEPVNIAQAEEEKAVLEARRQSLELRGDAVTIAYLELAEALNDFQSSYRLRLAEAASQYYRDLTGLEGRRVELNEDFQVAVVIDGRPVAPAQLSYGARDQLYIALRLGIARLLAADTVLPFVFDDPFLNCDAERLAKIGTSLRLLANERQVILLSHRADFAAWGEAVVVAPGV